MKSSTFQIVLFIFLVAVFVIYIFQFANYVTQKNSEVEEDYQLVIKNTSKDIIGYLVDSPKCKIPNFKLLNDEILEHYFPINHLNCTDKELLTYTIVHANNDSASLYINQSLLQSVYSMNGSQPVTCCYSFIRRYPHRQFPDDFVQCDNCTNFTTSVSLESDVVNVVCHSNKKTVYENVHAVIVVNRSLINPSRLAKQNPKPVSVLLIGIDSLSRLNLIRQMPKTYDYLEASNWSPILGYTKIGDNTFPNIMAILTGLNSDTQEKICKPNLINGLMNCPLIWKEFKKLGYITAYAEDNGNLNTFNLNRKGFKVDPVDYYFRKYSIAVDELPKKYVGDLKYCTGPEIAGQRILDLAKTFTTTYLNLAPTFGLFWMSSFTHGNFNGASLMDLEILDFFDNLNRSGVLNDSLVVFFSDHGSRFDSVRFTYTGWYEDRLPFIYLSVPEWFQNQYVEEFENLQANRNKLSSNYELHVTLRHILNLSGAHLYKSSESCAKCQSFFDNLPPDRSCEDLGIDQHWCTCSALMKPKTISEVDEKAVDFLIEVINDKILRKFDLECFHYEVDKIMEVYEKREYMPMNSIDGKIIIVRIQTIPNATFEATVQFSSGGKYKLAGDISRLDKYGSKGNCMKNPYLQKFCICKYPVIA